MINPIFGELSFRIGWQTNTVITLYGKKHDITVKAKAYSEKDGVSAEQEQSYAAFTHNQTDLLHAAEELLNTYAEKGAEERFLPRRLLIDRDGGCALLFDDKEDADGGIAVTFIPRVEIISQDAYL